MIYFDNAATTFPKPQCVYDAIDFAMKNYSFNAGRGSYKEAISTYKMINETRNKIGGLVGSIAENVIFTSSATEALNNIIYGLNLEEGECVFVSPFEHNAIVRTLHNVRAKIVVIPFDKDTWKLKEGEFEDLLIVHKPKAVLISHISNVTGYELPYAEIFNISKRYNCINVLDSAQGFGVHCINKANVDYIVFAGHKSLFAMFGIAGYIKLSKCSQKVYKVGGTGSDSLNPLMPDALPNHFEAGSMNSVAIYSVNKSIDFLKENNFKEKEYTLVRYLLEKLHKIECVKIYLPKGYVSNGIVSFNIEGFSSDEVASILSDEYDICVRSGYHCAPYVHDFINSTEFYGTVRISLSGFNTIEEINVLIDAISEIVSY